MWGSFLRMKDGKESWFGVTTGPGSCPWDGLDVRQDWLGVLAAERGYDELDGCSVATRISSGVHSRTFFSACRMIHAF